MALVKNSGSTGLSALLPSHDRVVPAQRDVMTPSAMSIPHLPLVSDWHDGDFSAQAVLSDSGVSGEDTSLRAFALSLLQRYRYVIGDTPSLFERITSARAARSVLDRIDKYKENALLCINDDVSWGDEEVTNIMREWQDRKWSRRAAWER